MEDTQDTYLNLLAAWGELPLDEEGAKEILQEFVKAIRKQTLKEVLQMPFMKEEEVLNKIGHNATYVGKPKPEKLRNDLRGNIRFVLLKQISKIEA